MNELPLKQRDQTIDFLRGIVIILMVLDHARDFFFGIQIKATNLEVTTPLLFFTRWITHFCAPTFVLLAGMSAYLYGVQYDKQKLSLFLFKRGVWLVLLELVLIRLGWTPDLAYRLTLLQVIWVLGWSMIFLSVLLYLPIRLIGLLGVLIIFGHNFFDSFQLSNSETWGWFWKIFLEGGKLELFKGHRFLVTYPILPWLGVLLFGFSLGPIVARPLEKRRKTFMIIGALFVFLFIVFRFLNQYGDPHSWSLQKNSFFTLMSFINAEKYPPSFLYLMMTLGLLFLVFGLLDFLPRKSLWNPVVIIGSVPLFFYILHLFLLRYISIPLAYSRWGESAFQFPPKGHGLSPEYPLYVTYLVWIAALLVLYPLCVWYARIKKNKKSEWLSYL